jgi:60 kDa SS-A/Ro ribonucleoprotein
MFSANSREKGIDMKLNKKVSVPQVPVFTAEGGPAKQISNLLQLKRSVLSTMLWEDNFYEDGEDVARRIQNLVAKVPAKQVQQLAIEARSQGKLRHTPLLLARAMAPLPTHREHVADTLAEIIQRPDELSEFVAIYWKNGKQPLSAQVKKGLARAFVKFDEYALAKYNRDHSVKLRDVLFLCHAKPQDKKQEKLWKKLVNDELKTPDTWEVALSASQGENKLETWNRLLEEEKLGGLALLRNLRNMKQAGVDDNLIRKALKKMRVERVLPYRFISAARFVPHLEPELEEAMLKAIENSGRKIGGKTVLLIDVSGSMDQPLSRQSDAKRIDAACGLALLAREIYSDVEVYTFSDGLVQVPSRRGFALRDAIVQSQPHSGTNLGLSLGQLRTQYDRLIVFTDEQSADRPPAPRKGAKGYVVNVASEKNGVGYGAWNHVDGFSESILDYILEVERLED